MCMEPHFFASQDDLREWFSEHHSQFEEVWIGYFRKGTGIPSIDWAQSVDVALSFGWIDGVRKSLDSQSYKIRFTPRRPRSRWSTRNIARMKALLAEGVVEAPGLLAFNSRNADPPDYEEPATTLPPLFEKRLRDNPDAWAFFESSRPSYRKYAAVWIGSAKKEETRLKRLEQLIDCSKRGLPVPPLRWSSSVRRKPR